MADLRSRALAITLSAATAGATLISAGTAGALQATPIASGQATAAAGPAVKSAEPTVAGRSEARKSRRTPKVILSKQPGTLSVNVNPNLPRQDFRVVLHRRVAGKWLRAGRTTTVGAAERARFTNLPKAAYRVRVSGVTGFRAKTTQRVRVTALRFGPSSGPSTWRGQQLRHPRGGSFYPSVERWANLVLAVMREHGISDSYLPGILAQIQQESGGQPYAVNNWDSNAAAGHPSKGLLQVIAPTYSYYAKSGLKSTAYMTNPYANIWAALNYAKQRYGMSKFASWTAGYNHGY